MMTEKRLLQLPLDVRDGYKRAYNVNDRYPGFVIENPGLRTLDISIKRKGDIIFQTYIPSSRGHVSAIPLLPGDKIYYKGLPLVKQVFVEEWPDYDGFLQDE